MYNYMNLSHSSTAQAEKRHIETKIQQICYFFYCLFSSLTTCVCVWILSKKIYLHTHSYTFGNMKNAHWVEKSQCTAGMIPLYSILFWQHFKNVYLFFFKFTTETESGKRCKISDTYLLFVMWNAWNFM